MTDPREALQKIVQWSDAYPLSVFPEPDLKKARALLEVGGITLDAISAHCMRHVVEGVGKIARAALAAQPAPGGREVTDAMCEAAIKASHVDRIQGFSYDKRHIIRDVWRDPAQQEIWSSPVAGPEEYEAFQQQCRIERMRLMLQAALALSPQERKPA